MIRRATTRKRFVAALASLAAVIALNASCRDATEVEIVVHTNVVYRDGLVTAFTVGAPGTIEGVPATTETRAPWGADGNVGSLVVVPGGAKDGRLSVKIVMGVDRDARDCTGADTRGCIVARRALRYVPHDHLLLPIELYASCAGVTCDAATTCNAEGTCVTAEIDPGTCGSDHGCDVPGSKGGAPPGGDAAIGDALEEAIPADGPFEVGAVGGGPKCPIVGGPSCGFALSCCMNGVGKYACTSGKDERCAATATEFACTNARNCAAGSLCCLLGQAAACKPVAVKCGGSYVCERDVDCPGGTTCSGIDNGYPNMKFCAP